MDCKASLFIKSVGDGTTSETGVGGRHLLVPGRLASLDPKQPHRNCVN